MVDDKRTTSEQLLEDAKRLFDASVEGIDAGTAGRLRAARQRATREAAPWAWAASPRLWLPAAAAAGLLAVLVLPGLQQAPPDNERGFGTVAATDLEILLGEEELEMLAELEFYEWLDLQDGGAGEDEIADGVG
jgi:hypothetical protein